MSTHMDLFSVPFCGELDNPGDCIAEPYEIDYSNRQTTPDQQRIENYLATLDLSQRTLLHVGIGNSSLALRFARNCLWIDGLTVSPREHQKALGLRLRNYSPVCFSKYSLLLPTILQRRYDLIIDNNPISYACCGFHVLVMFCNYRSLLNQGGAILTDIQGLGWAARDTRWCTTTEDWRRISRHLHMDVFELTNTVHALVQTHEIRCQSASKSAGLLRCGNHNETLR